jgi:hypothetical protein
MNITDLEALVLATIKTGDEWDDRPTKHFDDIAAESGIPANQLRGVISSLDQKNLIIEAELPTCMAWQLLT